MIVASYNVENMFRRPKVFNPETKATNTKIIAAYTKLISLLEQDSYAGNEDEILELIGTLGLLRVDEGRFAVMRKIRGKLLKRPEKPKPVEVAAKGRADWIGWVELRKEAIDSIATENTAAVIADVDPDVLAVVEAEDRMTLERFDEYVLKKVTKREGERWQFGHVMLVDGNDERGIDVGAMTKERFPIGKVRSHIDDKDEKGDLIFSRDCPEYEISVPGGGSLLLMVNHFKSQRGGGAGRRKLQAEEVAKIYRRRRREGWDWIVVAGDLNDTPESDPLAPLLAKTSLEDAGQHETFDWGERRGTYGSTNDQFDYLLLSPELFKRIRAGGVNRKGIWRGERTRTPWAMLPTLKKPEEAASDHAAVWVDLDV